MAQMPTTLWRKVNDFVHRQNPWIGIILFLISTVIATYLAIGDRGVLAYRHSVIKIVDSRNAGSLKVMTDRYQKIENDVYAIETTLKNAGNLPFDESRAREPLHIRFPKGSILQSSVSASTAPDVNRFSVHVAQPSPNDPINIVQVDWEHFDPGQYVTVTTLVASSEEVKPRIEGSLFGVEIKEGQKAESLPKKIWLAFSGVMLAIFAAIGAYSALSGSISYFRMRSFIKGILFGLLGLVIGLVLIFSVVAIYLVWIAPTVP